jgi:hypothetical protein
VDSAEPMKKAKIERYSNRGLSSTVSQASQHFPTLRDDERVIARSRVWDEESNDWKIWSYHVIRMNHHGMKSKIFVLNRGGKLKFFAQLIPDTAGIQKEMTDCKLYRQYSIRYSVEPRVHALFYNKKPLNSLQTGY